MTFHHKQDLVGTFAQHRVAANLLMAMMLMAGFWALSKMNTQFFPTFELDVITVRVIWSGASAEDIETSITSPIERELRDLDNVKKMTSTSSNGVSVITLEYHEGSNMGEALDQVNEKVALIRNLPSTSEKPEVSRVVRYESIARLLLYGPDSLDELRRQAYQMEQALLKRGIAKITLSGLPEEEIAIQISAAKLEDLGLSLDQVADKIAAISRDLPAGSIGRSDVARQLRSLDQRRDAMDFLDIPLLADSRGRLITVGDVADVVKRPQQGETRLEYQGHPAVELQLFRAEQDDSLESAKIIRGWLEETQPTLPPKLQLEVYDESWRLIEERIMLLVKNGSTGLLLVIVILYLFLNGKVAWWVTVGIPVSLMATQAALYASGGSINMVSLFAMIMALGIIVDDAIVVGEDALTHYQTGENPLEAAEGGARRMLAPVMASSLTTISAFFPLMLIGGVIGNILVQIPIVIICVIIASLIESFFILPGHLRHSFHNMHHSQPGPTRQKLENGFNRFRDGFFRPLVEKALKFRWITLSLVVTTLILGIGLLASGRINFHFFPSPESTIINANASFAAGTPPERVETFVRHMEEMLWETNRELSPPGGTILHTAVPRLGQSTTADGRQTRQGDQFGSILVEMLDPDSREVRNAEFIKVWRKKIQAMPGLETLTIAERRGGPPGRDIDIRLSGHDPDILKTAALELADLLRNEPGVSAIEDDMPFGREQLIYTLRPEALAKGLSVTSVGQQLRAAFDGRLVQIFTQGRDEIEVRAVLPDAERYSLATLDQLTVRLPNGSSMPLLNAVELTPRKGFEALRHFNGELSVQVSGNVDNHVNNSNKILAKLQAKALPDLAVRYGVSYSLEGQAENQRETLGDMKRGLLFALAMIYLVLAWVFSSYGWPFIVMVAIPFGLIGALAGHLLMGLDLTILSLFGFFGLSGIVINDSIVLVTFYRHIRASGMSIHDALIEASCQRLRAVLLTSLTTIGGLLPLLFETSLQAQFLIPMAVSISFGLAFATVLVLLVVPTLLSIYEDAHARHVARRAM